MDYSKPSYRYAYSHACAYLNVALENICSRAFRIRNILFSQQPSRASHAACGPGCSGPSHRRLLPRGGRCWPPPLLGAPPCPSLGEALTQQEPDRQGPIPVCEGGACPRSGPCSRLCRGAGACSSARGGVGWCTSAGVSAALLGCGRQQAARVLTDTHAPVERSPHSRCWSCPSPPTFALEGLEASLPPPPQAAPDLLSLERTGWRLIKLERNGLTQCPLFCARLHSSDIAACADQWCVPSDCRVDMLRFVRMH